MRGFRNPKGSAQALASTVNIFGQPCLYCDRACPSISRSSSDRATEPCSTTSPAPHGRHDDAGDWEFESISLQQGVTCEPDVRPAIPLPLANPMWLDPPAQFRQIDEEIEGDIQVGEMAQPAGD